MAQLARAADGDRPKAVCDLMGLVHQGAMLQAVSVAAELRIADLMAAGHSSVAELARATSTHAPSLHRLLRALASLELCVEREDGLFKLSPKGALLSADAPNSLRAWILWSGKYQWPIWGNLLYSVRTGESARKRVTGTDGFEHLERNPEAAAVFNAAMVEITRLIAAEVLLAYDFSGIRRVVDVGGGHGALMAALLEAYPGMRGVIIDRPHAIEGARDCLADEGLGDRCDFVSGDFFESVPHGADAYLLKNIIHDWNDDRSRVILGNCRRAMPDHGRLLLIERLTPGRLESSPDHRAVAWFDLTMLLGSGGCQRTATELCTLLDSTGFKLNKIVQTALDYSIIEALPR